MTVTVDAPTESIVRERTYSWADPLPTAALAHELSGIEFLSKIVAGEIPAPPMAETLGFDLVEIAPGKAVFEGKPAEWHFNPIGTVHGGLAFTLLDSALACSIHSTLDAGVGYTTIEMKVNLTRAITAATGPLRAEAEAVHVGGRVATAEARLVDVEGKLYAHGTTTCLIMR